MEYHMLWVNKKIPIYILTLPSIGAIVGRHAKMEGFFFAEASANATGEEHTDVSGYEAGRQGRRI